MRTSTSFSDAAGNVGETAWMAAGPLAPGLSKLRPGPCEGAVLAHHLRASCRSPLAPVE